MARSLAVCPSCGSGARVFSRESGARVLGRVSYGAKIGVEVLQVVAIVLALFAVAYYLAPVLLLFPLVSLCLPKPASRGGKTVSHGRRRRGTRS